MDFVGTPFASDEDRDAAIRYLEVEGGIQLQTGQAPRALVRGRYEGGNVSLHIWEDFTHPALISGSG